MDRKNKKSEVLVCNSKEINEVNILILHNDEYNSFEYVIEQLQLICKHDTLQAGQCAIITHYKGQCEILNGEYNYLKIIKEKLINSGLSVSIEKNK